MESIVAGATTSVTVDDLTGFTRFLTDTLGNVNAFDGTKMLAIFNIEYRLVQSYLLSHVMYDWKENTLEGTGNGLISLTDGDNSYAFPTDLLTIDRIELNYTGNTNEWVPATIYKQESINSALANTANDNAIRGTKSKPVIWVRNKTIYVDPIPDASVTGGMKVYCTTLVTDLTATTGPVFATPFHPVLGYAAAERYFKQKEQWKKASAAQQDKIAMLQEMVAHYSTRESSSRSGLRPFMRSFR